MITESEANSLKESNAIFKDSDSLGLEYIGRQAGTTGGAVRRSDAAFVFLWIAFNSAYSQDIGIAYHVSEEAVLKLFEYALVV